MLQRYLSSFQLDPAGVTPLFGDISLDIPVKGLRFCGMFQRNLPIQFRQEPWRCGRTTCAATCLSAGIASRLRRAQRFKPVSVIVHTRRDLWHMKYVHGMRNVYDHPLSFLSSAEAEEVRRTASRTKFAVLDAVPAGSKLIGVFGFLGRYKGFDTVVRALHHLPEEYHLLIFGGVHPNEIKPHQSIDPVVSSLFDAGYIDTSVAERTRANPGASTPVVSLAVDGSMRDLLIEHPKGSVGPNSFPGRAERCRFPGGNGDLRRGSVSLSGGGAILLRPDFAIPGTRLSGDCLAHPHLSAVLRVITRT